MPSLLYVFLNISTPRAEEWAAQGKEKAGGGGEKMKRLTLDLPEGLHRAIKRRAVEEGVTMVKMLRTLLEERYGGE